MGNSYFYIRTKHLSHTESMDYMISVLLTLNQDSILKRTTPVKT